MVFWKSGKRLDEICAELVRLNVVVSGLKESVDEDMAQAKDQTEMAMKFKELQSENLELRRQIARLSQDRTPVFPYPLPRDIESQIDWEKIGMRPLK